MTTTEQDGDPFGGGVDLPISALANDRIVDAPTGISIREAAAKLEAEGVGLLVLRDDSKVAGVVSERDVVRAVANSDDLDGSAAAVGNGHTIKWATPTSTVTEVAGEMMANYIRHVLIADEDGELTGIVSVRDLLAVVLA